MKNCILVLLGCILLQADMLAQQAQLLSSGSLMLSTDTLYAIREVPGLARLRASFIDTVRNAQLLRTGTTWAMRPQVRVLESQLSLTFMHNAKLTASEVVAYDSMHISASVSYKTTADGPETTVRVPLRITHSEQSGVRTYARDSWFMPNVLWARITVDTFRCFPNTLTTEQLRRNLALFRAEILGEQYVIAPTGIGTPPVAPSGFRLRLSDNGGYAQLWWNTLDWADSYDLEWAFIENTGVSAPQINYTFKHNATRVNFSATQYEVPIVHDEGILLFRVRANGRRRNGSPVSGQWSFAESGNIPTRSTVRVVNNLLYIDSGLRHESGRKNWQYMGAFAENGLRKDLVTYHDGAFKNRQSISHLNTDGKHLIVGETFYDHHGRPVVQAMPVPFKPHADAERIAPMPAPGTGLAATPGSGSGGSLTLPGISTTGTGKTPRISKRRRSRDPFGGIGAGVPGMSSGSGSSSGSGTGIATLPGWALAQLAGSLSNPYAGLLPPLIGGPSVWADINRYFEHRPALRYQPAFNVNASGQPYSKRDFAPDSPHAGAFGTTSGAGNYYSPACPMGVPYRHLIPDAEGFPFSQTVYTPDLTGRVSKQSGVGADYRLGSGHEAHVTYTTPTQQELDRLFGNDVGHARHYKKHIVTDANGQMAMQYLDPSGTVIATAAAGSSPDNVEALAPEMLAQVADMARDHSRIEAEGTRKTAMRNVVITQDRSTLVLDYSLTPNQVRTTVCGSASVCDNAVYDVRMRVFDQTGRTWFNHTRQVGALDATQNCVTPSAYRKDTTLTLNRGTYTVEKILTLNALNEERYVAAGINAARTCVERAVETEIVAEPCVGDGCIPCAFEWAGGMFIRKAGNRPGCARACTFNAPNGVYNHQAYEALLRDMLPGGQYAELYFTDAAGERRLDVGRFPLSVFNTSGSRKLMRLESTPPPLSDLTGTYRKPAYPYRNADGSLAELDITDYYREFGFCLPDSVRMRGGRAFCSPAGILDLEYLQTVWQEAWSESLVPYHPEYGFYLAQIATRVSLNHDTTLMRADYATAVREGWLQDAGGPVSEATLGRDPFFPSASSAAPLFLSQMRDSLNRFRASDGTVMHVHQMIRLAVQCNSPYMLADAARLRACYADGQSSDLSPEQREAYWQSYRAIYLSTKADFMDRFRSRAFPLVARVNGCMDLERQSCPGCSDASLRDLFRHKQRRFQRDSCFKTGNIPTSDYDGDGEITSDERRNVRGNPTWFRNYLNHFCHVDTLEYDWMQFFNALLLEDKFVQRDVVIPSMPPLVLTADMIARFPDRATSPNFRWNAQVSGDRRSLSMRITHPTTGAEQARFTLRADAAFDWESIKYVSCITCENDKYSIMAYAADGVSTMLLLDDMRNLNLSNRCSQGMRQGDAIKYFGKQDYACCTPFFPPAPVAPPCQDGQRVIERMNEKYEIAHRLEAIRDSLVRNYRREAMRATEIMTVSWNEPVYHFTLFYRDAAGNLIKTVPPKGVIPMTSTSDVIAHRTGSGRPAWPAHNDGRSDTLSTIYRYNSLGNRTYRSTPDGGITRYYYDEVGRAIASVNAEQATRNALGYVLYDAQGRGTEAGILNLAPAATLNESVPGAAILPYSRIRGAVSTAPRNTSEVYKTVYDRDLGVSSAARMKFAEGAQKRLRGRVARQEFYTRGDLTTYTHATHISYDIAGNVREFVQDFASLGTIVPGAGAHAIKHMRYRYDLLTGRVTESVYQPGQADQFYHWYQYDAEGRILAVQTAQHRFEATDMREREVKYHYYLHGPVARAELGHDHLQGIDLAYTLRGQLKQMNSISSTIEADMGNDGRGLFATDAVAFSLQFFPGDYKPIGRTGMASTARLPFGTDGPAQYNGNVAAIITRNEGLDHGTDKTLATAYRYDQLGRLRTSRTYRAGSMMSAPSANTTNGLLGSARDLSWSSLGTNWAMDLQYDKNGNINQLQRYGATGSLIDQMGYAYEAGTNKLLRINDPTGQVLATGAATDMPRDNVYTYDAIGRLIQERSGGTADLTWSANDKLVSYVKDGRTTLFTYDAFGRRALKQELGAGGITTLSVRDLQGNILSTYELSATVTRWKEVPIYAAGRLAVWQPDTVLRAATPTTTGAWRMGQWRGTKAYELTQHTGEVLATISDRKLPVRVGRDATWSSDYLMAQEYYAFGMPLPGRTRTGGKAYRFGFQGMERDDNLRGGGNSYTTEFRQYDPRVGRWLSLDPMMEKYAGVSPYNAFLNNPITLTDPQGDDTEMNADQFMREYSQTESAVRAEEVADENVAAETAARLHQRFGNITVILDESATSEAMSTIESILGGVSTSIGHATEAVEAYDLLNGMSFRAGAETAFAQESAAMLQRIQREASTMRRARTARRHIAREVARMERRLAREGGGAVEAIIEASAHSDLLRNLGEVDRYILVFTILNDLAGGDMEGLLQTTLEELADLGVEELVKRASARFGLSAGGRLAAGMVSGAATEVAFQFAFPESAGDGVCTWVPPHPTIEFTSEYCRTYLQARAEMIQQIQQQRAQESEMRRRARMSDPRRFMTASGGFRGD